MNIIEELIPRGRINRPGTANSCEYITIHETSNSDKGANAASHAKYLKGLKKKTSWHYTVDDESIYRHIPDGEKSFHTSDKAVNESSIAIELCVNSDGKFEKTKENAAELVRELMKTHNIPIENVRTHRSWTGKACPAKLLKNGWEEFLEMCKKKPTEKYVTIDELREMGYTGIRF